MLDWYSQNYLPADLPVSCSLRPHLFLPLNQLTAMLGGQVPFTVTTPKLLSVLDPPMEVCSEPLALTWLWYPANSRSWGSELNFNGSQMPAVQPAFAGPIRPVLAQPLTGLQAPAFATGFDPMPRGPAGTTQPQARTTVARALPFSFDRRCALLWAVPW